MSSGRENRAFAAFLVIALIVIPVYAYTDRPTPRSTQPGAVLGNLQLRSITGGIAGMSQNGLGLNIKAVVYNPNGFGATLEAANYSVSANGHYMGEGQLGHAYDFAPQSSLTLVLPISISWKSALQTGGSYIVNWGDMAWKVNGTAEVKVGQFPIFVTFEFATS